MICTIGSLDITGMIKQPDGYAVTKEMLTTDATRTLSGKLQFTLIGFYPKLFLKFRVLSESEMQSVLAVLNTTSFNVDWEDPETGNTVSDTAMYAGDFKASKFTESKFSETSVNLIAFDPL